MRPAGSLKRGGGNKLKSLFPSEVRGGGSIFGQTCSLPGRRRINPSSALFLVSSLLLPDGDYFFIPFLTNCRTDRQGPGSHAPWPRTMKIPSPPVGQGQGSCGATGVLCVAKSGHGTPLHPCTFAPPTLLGSDMPGSCMNDPQRTQAYQQPRRSTSRAKRASADNHPIEREGTSEP